jgi:hypothetical protein
MADRLGRDLTHAGINLKEKTAEGKPRFEFLTWGNHEGINGFEHCDVVIMVGVLQRSLLELAAGIKAQEMNLSAPTSPERLRAVLESEVAHAVYQGASRGSCRRITKGMAGPMKLYVIHKSKELEPLMGSLMPNAVWSYLEPAHMSKAVEAVKTQHMLGQILVYLHGMPMGTDKVSTTEAKKAMGLTVNSTAQLQLFTRTCKLLDLDTHGWTHAGRSFVRGSMACCFAYGD